MTTTTSPQSSRLYYFDAIRNVAILSVVLFHAAAAYSSMAPYWQVHDGVSWLGDFIRQVFDIFMMPIFFFLAGFFVLPSIEKRGIKQFLVEKGRRLGIPWLIAVFLIIPVVMSSASQMQQAGAGATPFWRYWLAYVSGFGSLHLGLMQPGQPYQMHFWYISLLLFFFLLFAAGYRLLATRWKPSATSVPDSPAAVRKVLLIFGLITISVYFVCSLLFADMSWATVGLLLQFQPAKVLGYFLYFLLGAYACSRQWFRGDSFPQNIPFWSIACVALTAGFLALG